MKSGKLKDFENALETILSEYSDKYDRFESFDSDPDTIIIEDHDSYEINNRFEDAEDDSKKELLAKDDRYDSYNQFEDFDTNSPAMVTEDGDQYSFMDQESAELIWVKESCDITVNSTDTQVGLSLQGSLQLAIALILNIAIGDSDRSEAVSQELTQAFNNDQINRQKIFIYNTKNATVNTTDTDLAINIQVLLQLLLTVAIMIDLF